MNGRDEQTDCRRQCNNTRLPPPERTHKGQRVPQIAQKKFVGANFGTKLKNEKFPPKSSPDEVPCVGRACAVWCSGAACGRDGPLHTFGGLMPTRAKISGLINGSSMTSLSSRICSCNPPTALKEIAPGSSCRML